MPLFDQWSQWKQWISVSVVSILVLFLETWNSFFSWTKALYKIFYFEDIHYCKSYHDTRWGSHNYCWSNKSERRGCQLISVNCFLFWSPNIKCIIRSTHIYMYGTYWQINVQTFSLTVLYSTYRLTVPYAKSSATGLSRDLRSTISQR